MSEAISEEQKTTLLVLMHKIVSLGFEADFVPPVVTGPVVSVFRFLPKGKTRVSHLEGLANDFAVALGVETVFAKRLPGETAVGVFVPNKNPKLVSWKDVVGALWQDKQRYIPLLLGVDHLNRVVVEDLTLFPHLLIAGSTGSGKSTLLASIIAGTVTSCNSSELQLVLSDTKGVEFGYFVGAPHLLFDEPAMSVYQTLEQLDWCIEEMQNRLKLLGSKGVHNILEYNEVSSSPLPYIVIIVDELADILGDSSKPEEGRGPSLGKIAEGKLTKLASKARASGIHIIAATQRPSVKLVEGNIKANFPARITFRLPSEADSRTILGISGAEHLLSRGDMLFVSPNSPGIKRIHAPIAPLEDIKAAVRYATAREMQKEEK